MKCLLNNGKEVEILLSFDDGCKEDLRIAELLRQYDLTATFYIPSRKRDLTDDQVRELAAEFDIGGHTINHRFLRTVPQPEAECEIKDGKMDLEKLIGAEITSFCYPRGQFTPAIKEFVRQAGFTEGRTTRVLCTSRADPYELDTTIHVYDRKEYEGKHWLSVALEYFDKVLDEENNDDYFHLWGHGWEISKFNNWKDFEFMLSYMNKCL